MSDINKDKTFSKYLLQRLKLWLGIETTYDEIKALWVFFGGGIGVFLAIYLTFFCGIGYEQTHSLIPILPALVFIIGILLMILVNRVYTIKKEYNQMKKENE